MAEVKTKIIVGRPVAAPSEPRVVEAREMTAAEIASLEAAQAAAVPTLEDSRAQALQRINTEHAAVLRVITGNATREEVDTWTAKATAAEAVLAGAATPAQTAMIAGEASGAGVTEAQLAQIVADNAAAYMALVGQAGGLRMAARNAVAGAATIAEVEAAIDTLKQQAAAMIAAVQAPQGD